MAGLAETPATSDLLDVLLKDLCPGKLHIPLKVRDRSNVRQSMDDPLHRRCHNCCALASEIRVHGDQQCEHGQQYQGQYDHSDDLDGCKEDENIFDSLHGCDQ